MWWAYQEAKTELYFPGRFKFQTLVVMWILWQLPQLVCTWLNLYLQTNLPATLFWYFYFVFIFSKATEMTKLLSAFKWKSKTSVWCRSCKDNEAHLQCAASHDKIFSADIGYWPKLSLLTEQLHCCTHKRTWMTLWKWEKMYLNFVKKWHFLGSC